LANIYGTLFLPSGDVVVAHPLPPITDPRPFHIISRSGERILSFGESDMKGERLNTPSFHSAASVIEDSGREQFWTASQSGYRLELWGSKGQLIRSIQRTAPWFKQSDAGTSVTAGNSLLPNRVIALDRDTAGFLWTILMIPIERLQADAGPMFGFQDVNRFY